MNNRIHEQDCHPKMKGQASIMAGPIPTFSFLKC